MQIPLELLAVLSLPWHTMVMTLRQMILCFFPLLGQRFVGVQNGREAAPSLKDKVNYISHYIERVQKSGQEMSRKVLDLHCLCGCVLVHAYTHVCMWGACVCHCEWSQRPTSSVFGNRSPNAAFLVGMQRLGCVL